MNGLLSRLEDGGRITFGELLRTELTAHGELQPNEHGSQVSLHGPEGIRLRSSQVQIFALALHELATNALKHGALSRPKGRLDVSWDLVEGRGGEKRLRVEWRESGVPMPAPKQEDCSEGEPLPRRGFGRDLLERILPLQLKAEISYDLGPDGLRCSITLPISTTPEASSPAMEGPEH